MAFWKELDIQQFLLCEGLVGLEIVLILSVSTLGRCSAVLKGLNLTVSTLGRAWWSSKNLNLTVSTLRGCRWC